MEFHAQRRLTARASALLAKPAMSPRRFLHQQRREGNRQVAGNAAMSAAGGEKRKTLEKWAFRGACPQTFQKLKIYAQKNCPVCGTAVAKVTLGGRTSWYCPKCQK